MRDISLHLMDIIQNSITAGARKVEVYITAVTAPDELRVCVSDDGEGMDKELLERVTSPFSTTRTTRKIGLGIPLLKSSAMQSGGDVYINSVKGQGTTLEAVFKISSIDRIPLGDIADTFGAVISANPGIDFELVLMKNSGKSFEFSTEEVKARILEVPINNYEVVDWIKKFIDEGVKITFGGVLNEINS